MDGYITPRRRAHAILEATVGEPSTMVAVRPEGQGDPGRERSLYFKDLPPTQRLLPGASLSDACDRVVVEAKGQGPWSKTEHMDEAVAQAMKLAPKAGAAVLGLQVGETKVATCPKCQEPSFKAVRPYRRIYGECPCGFAFAMTPGV
jgi:hypothetical protein